MADFNHRKMTEDIINHPFFSHLQNGYFNSWEFYHKFINFRDVIVSWSMALSNLLIYDDDMSHRLVIGDNLQSELNGQYRHMHVQTFMQFMGLCRRIPIPGTLPDTPIHAKYLCDSTNYPNMHKFCNDLENIATSIGDEYFEESLDYSYTFLGTIEQLYVPICKYICHCVSEPYNTPEDNVPHFSLHAKIGIQHADEMLSLVSNEYDKQIAQKDAYDLFYKLFDDFMPTIAT